MEILTLLLENPTDDSVEVAIGFLKECGLKLSEVAPKGMHGMCAVCVCVVVVVVVHASASLSLLPWAKKKNLTHIATVNPAV